MEHNEYKKLVDNIYKLIMDELEYYNKPDDNRKLVSIYPKLIIMWQFFRLLRGEAFLDAGFRPHTPEYQHEYYEMEENIHIKLKEVEKHLDKTDLTAIDSMKMMREKFNL